jgi:hypothetical protein
MSERRMPIAIESPEQMDDAWPKPAELPAAERTGG